MNILKKLDIVISETSQAQIADYTRQAAIIICNTSRLGINVERTG